LELAGRTFSRWEASSRREEALQVLKKAVDMMVADHERQGLHLELAGIYYLAAETKIALELFTGPSLRIIMQSFLHLGLYEEAGVVGQKWWDAEPDPRVKGEITLALAGIELRQGRQAAAVKLVDEYLGGRKREKDETAIRRLSLALAETYVRQGDFARARNIYQRLQGFGVDFSAADLVDYARALQKTEGTRQAADVYRRAIEKLAAATTLSPAYYEACWRWGDVLFQLGRYEESELAYRKSREGKLPPADDFWVSFQLGRIRQEANNPAAAREIWEAMRKKAGNDPYWAPLADFLFRVSGS
jgi:tetratricopeptide (TPR) repeat protein